MKDRSLFFFFTILTLFLLFGSVLFYRQSPETLPERARSALNTAGFRGLTAAFDGKKAYLLGEAPSEHDLAQASEVLGRLKDIEEVNLSHATVKPRLASPHLSLAFAGNQISVRGQVANLETKEEILAQLEKRFPGSKMDHDRLVIRGNVEDFGGFGEAPRTLPGVGERERERGVVAAVGGDVVWQVIPSGAGLEEIKAGLSRVLPKAEVAETMDEFDDVLTVESLLDEKEALSGNLKSAKQELVAEKDEVKSLTAEVGETREALREVEGRAQATEMALAMTKEELAKRESELAGVRREQAATVRALASAETARSGLEGQLEGMVAMLQKAESALDESRRREDEAVAMIDALKVESAKREAEIAQLGAELERGASVTEAKIEEAADKVAAAEAALAAAKSEIQKSNAQMEAMAAQHAAEAMAADKQFEAVNADFESKLEQVRGEALRLKGALAEAEERVAEAEARAASVEAKFMRTGPVRPAPESVREAKSPNAERDKGVDAVRGAAAVAAERARAAAEDSVGRAEALRSRGAKPDPDSGGDDGEPDPSGKPTPSFGQSGMIRLDALRKLATKNIDPSPDDIQTAAEIERLKEALDAQNRMIEEMKRNHEAERDAGAAVIGALREENETLRGALEQMIGGADDDSRLEKAKAEKNDRVDEKVARDPLDDVFAHLEGRLDEARTTGPLGSAPVESSASATPSQVLTATEAALAFEEIAYLQGRIAELEIELAEALIAQSEALAKGGRPKAESSRTSSVGVPLAASVVDLGGCFQRPDVIDNKLRSILAN